MLVISSMPDCWSQLTVKIVGFRILGHHIAIYRVHQPTGLLRIPLVWWWLASDVVTGVHPSQTVLSARFGVYIVLLNQAMRKVLLFLESLSAPRSPQPAGASRCSPASWVPSVRAAGVVVYSHCASQLRLSSPRWVLANCLWHPS
jgi:hypothetical protein